MITGLTVAQQIQIAQGQALPEQAQLNCHGHAVEASSMPKTCMTLGRRRAGCLNSSVNRWHISGSIPASSLART